MPKYAKPWFRPERGVWYVTLGGKQINLGSNRAAAFQEYARLISEPQPREVRSGSLAAIVDSFLEWVQRQRSPDTYEWYRYRLERFVRRFPDLRAADVRPYQVQEWADGYEVSTTTRRNYLRTVKRCFSWATLQGHLDKNPVAGLELPAGDHREVVISPEEFEAILASVRNTELRDLLVVTWDTGCRPQESLRVEARHVDLANQRWVFPKSESKNKKLSRVVYLSDAAAEITRRLVALHPTGPIFRNSDGVPWTTCAVNCAFRMIRIRIGKDRMRESGLEVPEAEMAKMIPTLKPSHRIKGKEIPKTPAELRGEARAKIADKWALRLVPNWSLYTLRHSWATFALQKNIDPLTVAILLGHSDPSMLSKVYQHVALNPVHMLEQAKKAAR